MLRFFSKATLPHYIGFTLSLVFLGCYFSLQTGSHTGIMPPRLWSKGVYALLGAVATLTTGWLGNRIANRFGEEKTRSTYFLAVFTLLLAALPASMGDWRIAMGTTLVNAAFFGLVAQSQHPMKRLFWVGLLLGCAARVYPPLGVFIFSACGAALLFFRPYWKYALVLLIGAAASFFYAYSYAYLFSHPSLHDAIWDFYRPRMRPLARHQKWIDLLFLSLLVYTLLRYLGKPTVLNSLEKRQFRATLGFWGLALGLSPFFFQVRESLIFAVFTPFALLITMGFAKLFTRWEGEIIFWLLLSAALIGLQGG